MHTAMANASIWAVARIPLFRLQRRSVLTDLLCRDYRLFEEKRKGEWTGGDLNPGPLPCEGSDLPLIYRPAYIVPRSAGV